MGTLEEDLDALETEARQAFARKDVLTGLGALAKIGGQFAGLFTVAYAAMMAGVAASVILGPLGLSIPAGVIAVLVRNAGQAYSRLSSSQRKGVTVVLGLLSGKVPFGSVNWNG